MQAMVDRPEVEYLDGAAHPKMSPKATHSLVQGAFIVLFAELGGARGKVMPELRCRLGDVDGTHTLFVPDVAFMTNASWSALTPQVREEPPRAPDIAVEVRSPRESAAYRARKIERYLATGAVLVFDVDPRRCALHVWTATGELELGEGDRFEGCDFPWLRFPVARLFADLD